MTYEAWRISYQSSEQAARVAYEDNMRLRTELDALRSQGEPVAWMNAKKDMTYFGHYNPDDVPDGWQLVPVEPTEEMCLAYTKCKTEAGEKWARHQWAAMLAAATQPAIPDGWQSVAVRDVLAERRRQIETEGWTPEHDDTHENGQMARAAACYALRAAGFKQDGRLIMQFWPWPEWWWKPTTALRDLVKAAALLLAEIERKYRAAAKERSWKPCSSCTTPNYCTNGLRGCDIAESLEAGITPIACPKDSS